MATDQKGEGSGFWLPAILIASAGIWWWNSSSAEAPPPPVFVPTAANPSPRPQPLPVASPTPVPTPTPTHNYAFVEGDLYGYIAAISENDRKAGKRAGDVLTFRYAGYWDGQYNLEQVDDAGNIVAVSTCGKPCIAIKDYSARSMRRIAYDPASIIGSAMEDAMNGRLKRKKREQARQAPPAPHSEADAAEPTPEAVPPTT